MPEQPRTDPADKMPVNTQAARHTAPSRGPVPTSEAPASALKREAEPEVDPALQWWIEREEPTPDQKRHAKFMEEQFQARAEQSDDAGGQVRKLPRPDMRVVKPKHVEVPNVQVTVVVPNVGAESQTQPEDAVRWYREASNRARREQILEGEMARERGEYPGMNTGQVYGAPIGARIAEMKTLELPPEGVVDVIDAQPRGMASRSSPETRGGF